MTSSDILKRFDKLVTRPQYREEASLTEGVSGTSQENKQIEIEGACRINETDPARLNLAAHVLGAALQLYFAENMPNPNMARSLRLVTFDDDPEGVAN